MSPSCDRNLKNLGRSGLERLMSVLGEPSYRAVQIARWLYKRDIGSIDEMRNIPKALRDRLARDWEIERSSLKAVSSSSDASKKLVIEFGEQRSVEAVYLPSKKRTTLCLSAQTGCPMGCTFCATARLSSADALTIGEVLEELLIVPRASPQGAGLAKPTHVVFMGMGEPLLKPHTLIEVVRVLTWEHGFEYAQRRITVSTCGMVEGIRLLADSGQRPGLALSLNAPWEGLRRRIMPLAPPLDHILPALRYYAAKTRRRVTLEYVLIDGINDSVLHATALAALSRTLPCKINLIPFNPFPGSNLRASPPSRIERFVKTLLPRAPAVTLRQSMGTDIMAACGQLAGSLQSQASLSN